MIIICLLVKYLFRFLCLHRNCGVSINYCSDKVALIPRKTLSGLIHHIYHHLIILLLLISKKKIYGILIMIERILSMNILTQFMANILIYHLNTWMLYTEDQILLLDLIIILNFKIICLMIIFNNI